MQTKIATVYVFTTSYILSKTLKKEKRNRKIKKRRKNAEKHQKYYYTMTRVTRV